MERDRTQSKLSKWAKGILTSLVEKLIFQKESTHTKVVKDLFILKSDLNRARDEYHQENYSQASKLLQPVISHLASISKSATPKNKQLSLLYASALTLEGLINEELKKTDNSNKAFKQAANLFCHYWTFGSDITIPQYYSDYGVTLEKIGQREEAITQLQEAVNLGISAPETFRYLGKALKKRGDYIEAEKVLKNSLQQYPSTPSIYQLLAEVLEAQGKVEEATDFYQEAALTLAASDQLDESLVLVNHALNLAPQNISILSLKAEVLYKKDNYEEALEILEQALEIEPDNVDFLTGKAVILSVIGRYNEAKVTSEQALFSLDKAPFILIDYLYILDDLAATLITIECYEKALELLDKALQLEPENAVNWGLKGLALLELKQYEKALLSLHKSIELDPELIWTYTTLGEALYNLERYSEALEYFNKTLKQKPDDVDTLALKGATLRLLGKHKKATESLKKALILEEGWSWLYGELGENLRFLGKYEEALLTIEKALDLEPNDPFMLGTKGQILNSLRRFPEATKVLQRSIAIDPELTWTFTELGKAFYMMDNYPDSLEALKKALEKNPEDFLALGFKGGCLRRMGLYEESLELLQKSVRFIKDLQESQKSAEDIFDIAWIVSELGKILYRFGRYKESCHEYEKALSLLNSLLELVENNTFILKRILGKKGQILRLLARYDEAIEVLKQSVELPPELAWVHIELAEALRLDKIDYQQAEDEINQALTLQSNNVQALGVKGAILAERDRYEEALQVLNKASKLPQPDYEFFLGIKSEILCDIAEYEVAAKVLNELTTLNLHNDWLFSLKGWTLTKPKTEKLLTETEQILGDKKLQEAKQAYENALKLNKKNLWRYKGIGEILYLLNDLEGAETQYTWIVEQSIAHELEDFELLGWCYYRLGEYARAAKFFIQALSVCDATNSFCTQFDLALTLMCSKRYALALQEYEKGLERIKDKSSLRRCGLLSVAFIDFRDAVKNNPDLGKVEQVEKTFILLKQALTKANNSKQKILSNINLNYYK